MHLDGSNDELWDEHKWEAHLNEVERKSDQLRKFISSDPKGNIPRWITLLKESLSEDDAFEAYVEEELLLDEAYFPEDEDWDDEDDEFDDEDFLFGFENELSELDESEDEFDEGEEWKSLSEDFADSDYGSLDNLIIYNEAKQLAVDVLKWAEKVPSKLQTNAFQEYVGEALKIGAKLAGGYSFGFEADYLGANIAYTKKALMSANLCLALLPSLKGQSIISKTEYQDFHSRLFELRNDTGVYIQELRDRFNNRID